MAFYLPSIPPAPTSFNVYYRNKEGKLGQLEASKVESHTEAISLVAAYLKDEKGPFLAVIEGGKK
jgi:hypothetical protein